VTDVYLAQLQTWVQKAQRLQADIDAIVQPPPQEEYETVCGWCQREVISFVAPPAMVDVHVDIPHTSHSVDRICLFCYAELIRLIAGRKRPSAN
jgi:hypothetical protein